MRHHPFPPHHERPAFGPFARGGFGDFPPGWGPGGPRGEFRGRGPRGPHRGRRGRRGDVRAAILALLAEQPRHGYEIISEIAERSGGFWRPSPGSVYPTLQLMADEDLVVAREDGGKRLFELTDAGREAAAKQDSAPPWEQIAHDVDPTEVDLRKAGAMLAAAAVQVSQAGTPGQKRRAAEILNEARRSIYAVLGEIETDDDEDDDE
ncbi:PadR family transcriptional regulator [Amycolatopsis thermophila]|uniref:DNA-binding PadR family transcriptional regulator n=1 Tax=Amycolatopsis thermophila TaxID=206084 RepID=A0ABU0EN30_9PSEU|nr:PadR family transcriptional regulator [Amycolatopsis thermophila]MDQ0376695.1 DNA-binding PadR family transcriptional regulator [Amycolatopsis thermophila]